MRIPPPAALAAAAVAQRVIAGRSRMTRTSKLGSALVGGASAWMLSGAVLRFVGAGTSLDPHRVDAASTLVIDGWHRRSRNPMYLGFAGILLSHAIARRSLAAVIPAAAFVAYLDRFQVPVEEAALRAKFADRYTAYADAVPRWLDRRSFHRS